MKTINDFTKNLVNKHFKPIFDAIPGEYMIAGGSALSAYEEEKRGKDVSVKDIDLFFPSIDAFYKTKDFLYSHGLPIQCRDYDEVFYVKIDQTEYEIDIIFKGFADYEAHLERFDLDISKIGFLRDGTMIYGSLFENVFNEKLITIVHHNDVNRTLWRVQKYIDKGYVIHDKHLSALIKQFFTEHPELFVFGYGDKKKDKPIDLNKPALDISYLDFDKLMDKKYRGQKYTKGRL